MMSCIWMIVAMAVSTPTKADAAPDPQVEAAVRALRASSGQPLVRVEASKVPESDDLFVAVCDWEDHWWGELRCVSVVAGKVAWEAKWDGEVAPDEQSLLCVRAFRDVRFKGPLVEVFGMTHMGNGNYYLYELQGRKLHLVLTTFAVDRHQDGSVIVGDRLDVKYRDVNGDGRDDIEFTGKVELSGDDGREVQVVPFRKTFLWNSKTEQFELDPNRSVIPMVHRERE